MDTSSITCLLFLTLVSYQLLLLQPHYSVSAADNKSVTWYKRRCQQQIFNCGVFGKFQFPFTNETSPTCALGRLDCSGPIPKLSLEKALYEVDHFPTRETVYVSYPPLSILKSSRSCDIFNYNISLPNSVSVDFMFFPNITLLKCYGYDQPPPYYTALGNHSCGHFTIYYPDPVRYRGVSVTNYTNFPSNCQIITLPATDAERWISTGGDLFARLASEFTIQFQVSTPCQDCIREGNRCSLHSSNFSCLELDKEVRPKQGSKLPLILGAVVSGGILVLCLFLIGIRYRKRWSDVSTYVFARSTSSDPSSTLDPEGGNMYFGVPIFSYTELQEATNNFDASTELGDGGFGTVYLGKLKDGREVAVKRLYERNYKRVTQFQNEIEILTRLRHKNLVSLYGCTSSQSRELLLVYEYIPNGTVADHLHGDRAKNGPLTWPNRMNIALETASALVYLHASEIIHRDVKTNNILLDQNFSVKVADFGLSRLFPTDKTHVSTAPQGTPGYVDPEYHQCYQLTEKSDVYSFGVVLAELISSLPAVDISRHRHEINLANLALNKIQSGELGDLVDPNLRFGSDARTERMITSVAEVAFRCLQVEKDMRPSMDEVSESLQEIADYKDEKKGEKLEKVGSRRTTAWVTPSPESEDVNLLKNRNVSTPDTMTDKWTSGSSTSTSNG